MGKKFKMCKVKVRKIFFNPLLMIQLDLVGNYFKFQKHIILYTYIT